MSYKRFYLLTIPILIAALGLLWLPSSVSADESVQLFPVDDGTIIDQSPFDGVGETVDHDQSIYVSFNSGISEFRGAMEFDLSSISPSSTIVSAYLNLRLTGKTYPTGTSSIPIDLFGYSGNGTVGIDDFNAGSDIATFDGWPVWSVTLDVTEFLKSQMPTDYIGFTLRTNLHRAGIWFDSLDGSIPPTLAITFATRQVSIDIKPGYDTNPININSMGKTQVAILSTIDFDAPSMVDTTSLTFGKTGYEASLAFCDEGVEDVNEDGLPDLICYFYTQSTGFQIGDTKGFLKGKTIDGIFIEGNDGVVIVFASGKNEFVDVCHNPGPDEVSLNIPLSAVDTHVAHGDNIGAPCGAIFAQCTDGWTSTFTETEKTYVLEVDKDTFEGRSTSIRTVDRVDESLKVTVTSLITWNNWSFSKPICGSLTCGYFFEWYATDPIAGEGTGVYKIEITQDQEGLVSLYCAD